MTTSRPRFGGGSRLSSARPGRRAKRATCPGTATPPTWPSSCTASPRAAASPHASWETRPRSTEPARRCVARSGRALSCLRRGRGARAGPGAAAALLLLLLLLRLGRLLRRDHARERSAEHRGPAVGRVRRDLLPRHV